MRPVRHVLVTLVVLLAVLALFEFSSVDLWLQSRLYSASTGQWLWDRHEPVTRFLLYNGIKVVYAAFTAGLLAALVFFRRRSAVLARRRGLLIVLLSLVLVPLAANALKAVTNVACPHALSGFGGSVPYVKLFDSYPQAQHPVDRQRCYPAGHASGGFALMSLCYLFSTPRRRRNALLAGVAAGWISGLYKMVIGDHFLSHTIVSMLMAWIIINAVAAVVLRGAPVRVPDRSSS